METYLDNAATSHPKPPAVLDAVRRAALTCYAVEGAYPQSLEALKHGYGLAYNEDAYIVVYDAFASNVMPDIQVLRKGAERP